MLSFKTIEKPPLDETIEPIQHSKYLRDTVKHSLKNYFSRLGGEEPKDIYEMVLSEVEQPLLECLIKYTKNNQVKLSKWLGLSRGTARKKLKKYELL